MPGRFALKPTLAKIWYAPDNFRIMDPLPPAHRRGIIIAALLVVIGLLLPSGDNGDDAPVRRDAQLDIAPSQPAPTAHSAAPTVSDPQLVAPVAPEPIQEQEQPEETQSNTAQTNVVQPFQESGGIDQQWRTYRIASGQTLAQLFRDHNLPATDVYAMAQVEGNGKPLSTLQTGQVVKIRQNASGVVTGLTIETGDGEVLFTRQANGSFIRAR
ncbi:LysM-like peptidoglycan-binding domain-containing protein [Pseudescherichia sp.]|uniref:LysM-like peptidoglycan-binding domain-containing protein n=1 Tax=Pseudescherichia sp. TaxID=2055881 RepID=UPI0028999C01|nr:LysM-like peptidoglycan-binding domain-containing protein [Pseudescherichia sp.]